MEVPLTVADTMPEVVAEVLDVDMSKSCIGQCKWFNNAYGYGFITIWDGPDKGKDIFVHHSGIKPLNSMYKTLKKGEYIMFEIADGDKGQQAVNVRGIYNGPLLCDHIPVKRSVTNAGDVSMQEGWATQSKKTAKPGNKRMRNDQMRMD
jgi:CspA family cold shock protein